MLSSRIPSCFLICTRCSDERKSSDCWRLETTWHSKSLVQVLSMASTHNPYRDPIKKLGHSSQLTFMLYHRLIRIGVFPCPRATQYIAMSARTTTNGAHDPPGVGSVPVSLIVRCYDNFKAVHSRGVRHSRFDACDVLLNTTKNAMNSI
jgi:hypothetical protein